METGNAATTQFSSNDKRIAFNAGEVGVVRVGDIPMVNYGTLASQSTEQWQVMHFIFFKTLSEDIIKFKIKYQLLPQNLVTITLQTGRFCPTTGRFCRRAISEYEVTAHFLVRLWKLTN